jgi:hypothetical protein
MDFNFPRSILSTLDAYIFEHSCDTGMGFGEVLVAGDLFLYGAATRVLGERTDVVIKLVYCKVDALGFISS